MKRWIAAAAALAGLIGTGASAQLITINGDTAGAPTYNRAINGGFGSLSGIGTNVGFQAVPFSVAANGNVRLETIVGPTAFDTFLFLYSSFNPANPLANGIAGNDDGGGAPCGGFSCSLINQVLAPGNYVAVGPTMVSGIGTNVGFQAVPFSVAANGNVRLETIVGPTAFDTFLFLYSSFNPANPLANGIAGNDDGGGAPCGGFSCSLINQVLAPGNYVAVVTGYANGNVGVEIVAGTQLRPG